MLSILVLVRDAVIALALAWIGVSVQPADPETKAAGGCAGGAVGVACADTSVGWGGSDCEKSR